MFVFFESKRGQVSIHSVGSAVTWSAAPLGRGQDWQNLVSLGFSKIERGSGGAPHCYGVDLPSTGAVTDIWDFSGKSRKIG